MDEEEIKQVLRSHQYSNGRRGFACPDETEVAAYVDQQLKAKPRKALERHFSGCDSCLQTIAFLTQAADWKASDAMPAYLVTRARTLINVNSRPVWSWRWPIATAAAACVLLVTSLVYLRVGEQQQIAPVELIAQNQPPVSVGSPQFSPPQPLPSRPVTKHNANRGDTPSVRGTQSEPKPNLLFPQEGSLLRRDQLEFRWRPVQDAVYYTVRVVTSEGSLKFEKETKEPALKLGSEIELQTSATYYVTVVAHHQEGRFTKSEIIKFRLARD